MFAKNVYNKMSTLD